MQTDGMSYCQWQKRNSTIYKQLSQKQQQKARKQGYYNVGWEKVRRSWQILQDEAVPPTIFAAKLRKGDVAGAVDQSILIAEKAQKLASQSLKSLNCSRKEVKKLAKTTLNKYQLL